MTCCHYSGMNGIINVHKPEGRTSFNVVRLVRRLTGEKKVGHAGTLDPLATGVLPVCIGQATRLVEYMIDSTKTYLAEIELGTTTDTYDAEGEIIGKSEVGGITLEQVKEVMSTFQGEITQTTPIYSALKYNGKPGYKLARAGVSIKPRKRLVKIDRIDIVDWQLPVVTVEIDCGKGTYIRSLAHDLGQVLGCGAYLKNLTRLHCGIFNIADAVKIDEMEQAFQIGYWERLLYPMDSVITHLPAVIVSEQNENTINNGTGVTLTEGIPGELCRAYNQCGNLLAILRFDSSKGIWHPEKVFNVLDSVSPM